MLHRWKLIPLSALYVLLFLSLFSFSLLAQTNPSITSTNTRISTNTKSAPTEIAVINLVASVQANKPIRDRFTRSLQYAGSHIPNSLVAQEQGNQIRFENNTFYLLNAQKIKLVYYDFDNRKDSCLKDANPNIIEKIEQQALMIVGAVSSDCTKSILKHPGFAGIPVLNSMSTADNLSRSAIHKHGNLFRTTFPDHYSVTKLVEEIQANAGREDLRSFNFGLLYNASSHYSSGLKDESYRQLGDLGGIYNLPSVSQINADTRNHPYAAVQKYKNIQLINMDFTASCDQLALPIHNMLILNYNAQMQSFIERMNACHHNQETATPNYFAIGSPELFKYLPHNSVVIARPNLEQFENVNKQFLTLTDKALLSSSTYLTMETLFATLNHLSAFPNTQWRESVMAFLRDNQFQSTLNKAFFEFDSGGELHGNLPSSSIYQLTASYELKNRISGKDSTLELININKANHLGWFDGSLLMKIVVPVSFKDKSVTLRFERDSQIDRLLTYLSNQLFGANNGSANPLKTRIYTRDILLESLNNGVYQHLPWFIGNYHITIQNTDGDIISNEVKYVVEWPMHLFITLFIACAVGLLLLERSLHEKMKRPLAVIRYFAGIIITAVVLHLLSVTFRNSDIATFMPFLSFSSNLVTNGVIIGILAGLNGLELIHAFLANIQGRFVPTNDDKPDVVAATSLNSAQPAPSQATIQEVMKQQARSLQADLVEPEKPVDAAEKEDK